MAKLGYKFSKESIEKMRQAKLGKKRFPHTEETKLKMSNASKGKKKSIEHIKSLILAKTGVAHILSEKGKKSFKEKMSGRNNPNWIEDRSLIKLGDRYLHDPLVKQWRMEVKKRDNFTCRIADNNCGGRIEVHHILRWSEFPELRYKVNNGITLCHAHHPRKMAEEKRLVPTFQELVLMPVSK